MLGMMLPARLPSSTLTPPLTSRPSRGSYAASAREETFSSLGFVGSALYRISEALEMANHRAQSNTEEGSKRNISYHYDAGNDFYKLFLDNTMM